MIFGADLPASTNDAEYEVGEIALLAPSHFNVRNAIEHEGIGEYLATYSKEFVQLIRSQFLERFFMQYRLNVHKII